MTESTDKAKPVAIRDLDDQELAAKAATLAKSIEANADDPEILDALQSRLDGIAKEQASRQRKADAQHAEDMAIAFEAITNATHTALHTRKDSVTYKVIPADKAETRIAKARAREVKADSRGPVLVGLLDSLAALYASEKPDPKALQKAIGSIVEWRTGVTPEETIVVRKRPRGVIVELTDKAQALNAETIKARLAEINVSGEYRMIATHWAPKRARTGGVKQFEVLAFDPDVLAKHLADSTSAVRASKVIATDGGSVKVGEQLTAIQLIDRLLLVKANGTLQGLHAAILAKGGSRSAPDMVGDLCTAGIVQVRQVADPDPDPEDDEDDDESIDEPTDDDVSPESTNTPDPVAVEAQA